jgi:hypothetical protein
MRDLGAIRIDALVLGQEAEPGNAEAVNLLTLLRRDLAFEPDKAALGRKPPAQFGCVDLRHHCCEQLGCLVHVDNPMRLREQRWRAHVGGQNLAVAVENVGPRRGHRVLGDEAPGPVPFRCGREHHETRGDNRITERENEQREEDACPRLGDTIDVAAIKQRIQQAPAPGLARRCRRVWHRVSHRCRHLVHLAGPSALPVAE